MKVLTIDNMLEAALESGMPGYAQFVEQAEMLATTLGRNLASHLGVQFGTAVWEGSEFGGLNVRFGAKDETASCPQVITDQDPDGDWELMSTTMIAPHHRRPNNLRLVSDPE